ncbi:Uncharacterized protein HZ326_31466, partial [Fusarium oxysporum f. sp. albedinis]
GRKALRGKWVFKLKRGENGQVLRYKARFVVRGFEQREGIDFNETFASVVKPMSYKMIFAIAAALDLELEQMDVKTAFLYGLVTEEIYVEQPEGFDDGSGRVCKLLRALYGLKQAPRVWYETLSTFLATLGFKPLLSDMGVFVKGHTFIAVYVDDLLIAGPSKDEIVAVKQALCNKFKMTDLGPCKYYLGMSGLWNGPVRPQRHTSFDKQVRRTRLRLQGNGRTQRMVCQGDWIPDVSHAWDETRHCLCRLLMQSTPGKPNQRASDSCQAYLSIPQGIAKSGTGVPGRTATSFRLHRLGLGGRFGDSKINVWICVQPWHRSYQLEFEETKDCGPVLM